MTKIIKKNGNNQYSQCFVFILNNLPIPIYYYYYCYYYSGDPGGLISNTVKRLLCCKCDSSW